MREHYLRDDIYCGAPFCTVCDSSGARLSDSASTILVLDTNVVLNQVCFFRFVAPLNFNLNSSFMLAAAKLVFELKIVV